MHRLHQDCVIQMSICAFSYSNVHVGRDYPFKAAHARAALLAEG